MTSVTVVGAGLAGSEAAWQLAQRGIQVRLYEMRPQVTTPAHETGHFAELVCSNSLGSVLETSAGGVLKMELERLDSLIIRTAKEHRVPAGGALAVDRELFAQAVTERLQNHPKIEIINEECTAIPEGVAVIATGPLTSPRLTEALKEITRSENLYFYDAAAPIVLGESVDYDKGFWGARYGKGTADYFNCPLTKEEYEEFVEALVTAEEAPLHEGDLGEEDLTVFEGCMPIEVMARRGKDALRYGPFKPVGLTDPEGKRPYAVLQLRLENTEATLFNLVGCQTRLKWGEQNRVFQLIPALRSAEFVRYGVMHRNTFINSPKVLNASFQCKDEQRIFLAGQLTGVEGYVESTASGLLAGINAARFALGQEVLAMPRETMLGSLAHYIAAADPGHFQPMNANFGILPVLDPPVRGKKDRKLAYAKRALDTLESFWTGL
ncbi:MAG: FADH(2)-oxidizing methylenetetrahydrofolate--tRNA-(uracil(54)-C(5))-methyltransferase TrmFO [Bacillota bacterium]|jgi:methylenetetrahydrofolate--tRNA-(uracil-5-)-methyltransferase|nr:FADH(2)-oxidizing methylenetetrahydrofolate--tRNA-(uracil(54)-C(5))-methyltransferase TrmFO [Bacillota bacterium]NLJ02759.1 FADH(2)-oxidizing methylenetetrahydrofolate--tRNA-(uracil(54)-C(5))-methyltransferase TrmFO [Bacillota bacterium]